MMATGGGGAGGSAGAAAAGSAAGGGDSDDAIAAAAATAGVLPLLSFMVTPGSMLVLGIRFLPLLASVGPMKDD